MSSEDPDAPQRAREHDCELNGHVFEGYDTFTEMCSFCGMVRERVRRAERASGNDIHVCLTAADHAFGMNGVCSLCGASESGLTPSEHQQYAARRSRGAE